MRISDWSSDVCSSDLIELRRFDRPRQVAGVAVRARGRLVERRVHPRMELRADGGGAILQDTPKDNDGAGDGCHWALDEIRHRTPPVRVAPAAVANRPGCGGVERVPRDTRAPGEHLPVLDAPSSIPT